MFRILLLPIILPLSLLWAVIVLPINLYYGRKLAKIEEGAKADLEEMAQRLDEETGSRVCRVCIGSNNLRVSPFPERVVSSEDKSCVLCKGSGAVFGT